MGMGAEGAMVRFGMGSECLREGFVGDRSEARREWRIGSAIAHVDTCRVARAIEASVCAV